MILEHAILLCSLVRRYALMGEGAARRSREFSRSMSDLKPGDLITYSTGLLSLSKLARVCAFKTLNALSRKLTHFRFLNAEGGNTRKRCEIRF